MEEMINKMKDCLKDIVDSEEFSNLRSELLEMKKDESFVTMLSQKEREELFELIKIGDELSEKYNLK